MKMLQTIIFIIFETFWCFIKFYFHHKWNDTWLLLANLVFKSCLTSCRTTQNYISSFKTSCNNSPVPSHPDKVNWEPLPESTLQWICPEKYRPGRAKEPFRRKCVRTPKIRCPVTNVPPYLGYWAPHPPRTLMHPRRRLQAPWEIDSPRVSLTNRLVGAPPNNWIYWQVDPSWISSCTRRPKFTESILISGRMTWEKNSLL